MKWIIIFSELVSSKSQHFDVYGNIMLHKEVAVLCSDCLYVRVPFPPRVLRAV